MGPAQRFFEQACRKADPFVDEKSLRPVGQMI